GGGGCINSGRGYETKSLGKVFVKSNIKKGSDVMFRGEFASLKAMLETGTVRVPRPISVVNLGGCTNTMKSALQASERSGSYVGGGHTTGNYKQGVKQFGFHTSTCCGFIPQNNEWCDDWAKGDRDIKSVWPELERKATQLLAPCADVIPGLIHGDLWGGNWSSCDDGPVIFDPAGAFCDPEFEQGIMNMFGGYGSDFWAEYHKVLPERPGRRQRVLLYELFHHLNHWNHFGSSYKGSSMSIIHQITGS
ncbi:fructosamine kinase, partial [Necator americanus]